MHHPTRTRRRFCNLPHRPRTPSQDQQTRQCLHRTFLPASAKVILLPSRGNVSAPKNYKTSGEHKSRNPPHAPHCNPPQHPRCPQPCTPPLRLRPNPHPLPAPARHPPHHAQPLLQHLVQHGPPHRLAHPPLDRPSPAHRRPHPRRRTSPTASSVPTPANVPALPQTVTAGHPHAHALPVRRRRH